MNLLVGIDGGATKTRAAVAAVGASTSDPSAIAQIQWGESGPANIAAAPMEDALANIRIAVSMAGAAPDDVSMLCAGLAGWSYAQRRNSLADALGRVYAGARIDIVPDYLAAFHGAFASGRGIATIAGTGSVAFGRNAAGATHKTGAYGYLIDDSGSGYGVGRAALVAVLREIDGTGERTSLTARVLEALGVSGWEDMISGVYGGVIDRARIAALSRVVALAAGDDRDSVAAQILQDAAAALAMLARGVRNRLFERDEVVEVAMAGSLWDSGEALTLAFAQKVAEFAPAAACIFPRFDPAIGALLLAQASHNRASSLGNSLP